LKHYASTKFWRYFNKLPKEIQKVARSNYALLKENPTHRSLHYKQVCNSQYRSVRVGLHYRALGVPVPDGVQWFWIGTHDEYDRLLG